MQVKICWWCRVVEYDTVATNSATCEHIVSALESLSPYVASADMLGL